METDFLGKKKPETNKTKQPRSTHKAKQNKKSANLKPKAHSTDIIIFPDVTVNATR